MTLRGRVSILLSILLSAYTYFLGTIVGKEIERALRAERPPDCLIEHPPIPEINRVTWKEGERRA